jgi:hypothetical protein
MANQGVADVDIRLQTVADGGNPREETCLKEKNKNEFVITPFSEDNDQNYKFRIEFDAINKSSSFKRAFVLELPWSGRTTDKMRAIGVHVLKAIPCL